MKLTAINFHYIRTNFNTPYPSIFGKTPEAFKDTLQQLAGYGEFIGEMDLLKALENPNWLPEKSILITFDDGLKEQYELAWPILQELKIPAIFFVNTQTLIEQKVQSVHKIHLIRSLVSSQELEQSLDQQFGDKFSSQKPGEIKDKAIQHYKYDSAEVANFKYKMNFLLTANELNGFIGHVFDKVIGDEKAIHEQLYMTRDMVAEMAAANAIGSHGHTHVPIGELDPMQKFEEASRSQQVLREVCGKRINAFSYPYGSKSSAKDMGRVLEKAGYAFAFTMERAINHKLSNPFLLSRLDNNDVPGGKAYHGISTSFFNHYPPADWHVEAEGYPVR